MKPGVSTCGANGLNQWSDGTARISARGAFAGGGVQLSAFSLRSGTLRLDGAGQLSGGVLSADADLSAGEASFAGLHKRWGLGYGRRPHSLNKEASRNFLRSILYYVHTLNNKGQPKQREENSTICRLHSNGKQKQTL